MSVAIGRARRFGFLLIASILGAIAFVPFLNASAPAPLSSSQGVGFVLIASIVAAVATWFGLGWADRAGLPMPMLRALERHHPGTPSRGGLTRALLVGTGLGVATIGLLRWAGLADGAGTLAIRISSALFAAVTLETVLHLAIMSGVVAATGRVGAGIAAATVAYVLFHLASITGQPGSVIALSVLANGLAGVLFGWLYARDGFEYLIVAHGLAHAIAVGFA